MPTVGLNTPFRKTCPTVFVAKNISHAERKRIRIFGYPIPYGMERDLLEIPYISEADIRHSLLKGELHQKLLAREITITQSNIDLVQFDPCQKAFLQSAGISIGLEGGGGGGVGSANYLFRQNVELLGPKNDANTVFSVIPGDYFINGIYDDNDFRIIVDHNGRRLIENIDYFVIESGGTGTGFDRIQIISFVPNAKSKIIADYTVRRPA